MNPEAQHKESSVQAGASGSVPSPPVLPEVRPSPCVPAPIRWCVTMTHSLLCVPVYLGVASSWPFSHPLPPSLSPPTLGPQPSFPLSLAPQ